MQLFPLLILLIVTSTSASSPFLGGSCIYDLRGNSFGFERTAADRLTAEGDFVFTDDEPGVGPTLQGGQLAAMELTFDNENDEQEGSYFLDFRKISIVVNGNREYVLEPTNTVLWSFDNENSDSLTGLHIAVDLVESVPGGYEDGLRRHRLRMTGQIINTNGFPCSDSDTHFYPTVGISLACMIAIATYIGYVFPAIDETSTSSVRPVTQYIVGVGLGAVISTILVSRADEVGDIEYGDYFAYSNGPLANASIVLGEAWVFLFNLYWFMAPSMDRCRKNAPYPTLALLWTANACLWIASPLIWFLFMFWVLGIVFVIPACCLGYAIDRKYANNLSGLVRTGSRPATPRTLDTQPQPLEEFNGKLDPDSVA